LLAGVAAAAAFCGAAVLLGSRRSVLVIGVVVLVAVTAGAVGSSWLGGRARDQGLLAAATACGARVGDYAVELGAVVGDVVNQNAWSRDDVSVSYWVDANDDKSANLLELRAWRTG
jgi:hypothetical protein